MRDTATKNHEAEYVGPREAAEILGLGTNAVRKAIQRGDLPAYRVGPKLIRIPVAALHDLAPVVPPREDAERSR